MEPKTCHHCGNEWTPRKENPKKCPRCQNSLWKSPRPKKISQAGDEAKRSPDLVNRGEGLPAEGGNGSDSPEYPTVEPECVRARIEEKDSLSQMKQRAESLLSRLI